LRWYELCSETLRRDLNVPPNDGMVTLAKRIVAGQDITLAEHRPDARPNAGFDQRLVKSRVA
jgi:hypothetical protein